MCDTNLQRLRKSWGPFFYEHCFPLIRETDFRALYSPDQGAPFKSVHLVVAALILQAYFDLTDA